MGNSLFCLDGRDEIPDGHGHVWKHMAQMSDKQGIAFTFTIHSVQAEREVRPDETLVNPEISEHRKTMFETANVFDKPDYQVNRKELQSRMETFLGI